MNVKQVAKGCNVSQQAVYKWLKKGFPAERAVEIERVTEGAIKREDLRPDIFK